jgi:sulfur relay (sulfurtransferase) DsrF/TusC family protein
MYFLNCFYNALVFNFFKTMYGKLQERKLNQQDFIMSCEVVRT